MFKQKPTTKICLDMESKSIKCKILQSLTYVQTPTITICCFKTLTKFNKASFYVRTPTKPACRFSHLLNMRHKELVIKYITRNIMNFNNNKLINGN